MTKVWVDYNSHPRSSFNIKVNDSDVYNLTKEEANYDPSKTECLNVNLNVNNKKNSNGNKEWAIYGSIPWIIDVLEDKMQAALGV